MNIIKDKFFRKIDMTTASVIENIRFENCTFGEGVYISHGIRRPEDAVIIRNCEFVKCTFLDRWSQDFGFQLGQAIIENVLVENCSGKQFTFRNTRLRHVTIKGKLQELNILMPLHQVPYNLDRFPHRFKGSYPDLKSIKGYYEEHELVYASEAELKAHREAFFEFYEETDWALDISEAKLGFICFRGLFPQNKIRFNPATQAYISKQNLLTKDWRGALTNRKTGYAEYRLRDTIGYEDYGCLLVAEHAKKERFNQELDVIRTLRELGIAEPGETAAPVELPKPKPVVNFKKPVFVFSVTVWSYDHGDLYLLANNASTAKKRVREEMSDLEPDLSKYTAQRQKKFDKLAEKLGQKVWHQEDAEFIKLLKEAEL